VRSVKYLIDGATVATFRNAPYTGTLDTTRLSNGAHTFVARVTARDGSVLDATVSITVSN
jgi:hypothetical protein